MKLIRVFLWVCLIPQSICAQTIVQNNNKSLTITPEKIEVGRYTSGNRNFGIGEGSLVNNTGDDNTAIGPFSLYANTSGDYNTAAGSFSLYSNEMGYANSSLGYASLQKNTNGFNNSALGSYALSENLTGSFNSAVGSYALFNNLSSFNTALGYRSLVSNSTGTGNSAMGSQSLQDNSTGSYNVAIGFNALQSFNGDSTVAIGVDALGSLTSGGYNLAIGSAALLDNISGEKNTVIGNNAFQNNLGSRNTGLGYQTFGNNINGSGNIGLGYQAGLNEPGSNKLYIENSGSETPLIGGDFALDRVGINRSMAQLAATNFTFQVNGEASKNSPGAWSGHSDRRLKKNIEPLNSAEILNKISQLQGVTYEWNDTVTGSKRPQGKQYGFIAQEIKKIFPEKVTEDANGYLMTAYGDFDPMLVEAIKALNQKVEEIEGLIEERIQIINNKQNTLEILLSKNSNSK